MKPPSSHRSSVALVYAAKMWSTPNWKRSFAGQFFSTHQGCSLLLRIHTTAGKDKMRRRFTYWKIQGHLYTHENKHWIHQQTTHKWWFGRSISFQLRGFACNCGGQRRPRIEPSSWNFFNLGIVAENYLVYLWVEPPFPTPKKWWPWRFWVGIFWAFVFVRILVAMNICWEGFEAQGIAWRSAG